MYVETKTGETLICFSLAGEKDVNGNSRTVVIPFSKIVYFHGTVDNTTYIYVAGNYSAIIVKDSVEDILSRIGNLCGKK